MSAMMAPICPPIRTHSNATLTIAHTKASQNLLCTNKREDVRPSQAMLSLSHITKRAQNIQNDSSRMPWIVSPANLSEQLHPSQIIFNIHNIQHTYPSSHRSGAITSHPSVTRTLRSFRSGSDVTRTHPNIRVFNLLNGVAVKPSPITRPAKRSRTVTFEKNLPDSDKPPRHSFPRIVKAGSPIPLSRHKRTRISHPPDPVLSLVANNEPSRQPQALADSKIVESEPKSVMADWLSIQILYIATKSGVRDAGGAINCARVPQRLLTETRSRIKTVLSTMQPPAEILFLSLWYLERLFPVGFSAVEDFHDEGCTSLVLNMFAIGVILATKWLDDYSFRVKDWERHCDLSSKSINSLEQAALLVLDYNLNISNTEWISWLHCLQRSAISNRCTPNLQANKAQLLVFSLVEDLLIDAYPIPHILSPTKPVSVDVSYSPFHSLLIKRIKTVANCLREPAPWDPQADPIIRTSTRTTGTAPCAHPPLAASLDVCSLLADVLNADSPIFAHAPQSHVT